MDKHSNQIARWLGCALSASLSFTSYDLRSRGGEQQPEPMIAANY